MPQPILPPLIALKLSCIHYQVFIRFASRQTENREDLSSDGDDEGDGDAERNGAAAAAAAIKV